MSISTVDFLRPPRAPQLGWWLLLTGVAALAAAVSCEQRWTAERMEAERAAQIKAEASRLKRQPARVAEPTASERRLLHAQRELRRPWLRALGSVESATNDPVYLLSLAFERGSGVLRLEAEAPSFDHALAYTQMLGSSKVLSSAALESHEHMANPAAGRDVVRFTMTMRWNAQ